ncbi:MAG: universal stress protein [Salinarimonadaceae bacterium]|nr:MAG: universal stress protein [Salinarimonadaceae bacterium]
MSYKDILVTLPPGGDAVGPYAASLAAALGARVRAAAVALDPTLPAYVIPQIPLAVLDRVEEEAREDARGRLAAFEEQAKAAGAKVEPFIVEGDMDTAFDRITKLARYHDLTIVEQAGPDRPALALLVETVLFGAGRPLLIVPYIQRAPFSLRSVIVAWTETAPAARALAAAMPMLERAEAIEIVTVDGADGDREGAERLAGILAGRGLRVRAKNLTGAGGVGDTILSHAADIGADMVVMGGYGHSRLRQFILGGATRDMLATMTVPTLMAH